MLDLWTGQMNQFDEYLTGNNLQRAHLMLEYAHLTLKGIRILVFIISSLRIFLKTS